MKSNQPYSFLKQVEALPKIRLGTKQYIRLDDLRSIITEEEKEIEKNYMKHYEQGRKDERAEREGSLMQTFSPD